MLHGVRSVSWLNDYVAQRLSDDPILANLSIVGEIAGGRRYPSGHYYFTLKDESAQVSCVFFSIQRARLGFEPRDGMRVICQARAALYPKDGRFQLIVQRLVQDGVGDLHRRFVETKARLEKEGLFAPELKRPLPFWPKRIGVVTSSAGAVLHDMIVVLKEHAPSFDLLLYPTAVQGEHAPLEIARAIERANRQRKVDVLIVGRGGGSFEDLYAYNEEIVVRAIRNSEIPVISAVGHETDVTLSDFAADLRMPTPTAAAAAVMPARKQLQNALAQTMARLSLSLRRQLKSQRQTLEAWHSRITLRHPARLLDMKRQTLDLTRERLPRALSARIEREQRTLESLKRSIEGHVLSTFNAEVRRADRVKERLHLLHPKNVLARGYAFLSDKNGVVLQRTSETKKGAKLIAHLSDGALEVTVDAINRDNDLEG